MVKLQFPPAEAEKEATTPILKPRRMPHVLPITIRDSRRQQDDDRAMSMFSFLATCLLFTGFLMVLFSVKTVWDLKIENWRLVKENAALKKTVRDNVPAEKFKQSVPSEADILEFEGPAKIDPDLSWSVSIQIFWSSPFITPCNMNWLARELADQIYERKKELDQEKKNEAKTIFEDYDKKSEKAEDEYLQIVDEVYEVVTGGPQEKSADYFESEIEDGTMIVEENNDDITEIGEALLASSDIVPQDKIYDEFLNEEGNDINIGIELKMVP